MDDELSMRGQGQIEPPHKYTKLGGWLLLFVILGGVGALIGVGTGISEILSVIALLGDYFLSGSFKTAMYVILFAQALNMASIAFSAVSIVNILGRGPLFLRHMQISRIVAGAANLLLFAVMGLIGFENYETSALSYTVGSTIGVVGGLFLMTYYYCKSVRVRVYMGGGEYMDKALFRYRQTPLN